MTFWQHLPLDILAELFYISYSISHLAERKCFGYKTPRFSQLLASFWMRGLCEQVHVRQARRCKVLKCVEILDIQLPFSSQLIVLNSSFEKDKKVPRELIVVANA